MIGETFVVSLRGRVLTLLTLLFLAVPLGTAAQERKLSDAGSKSPVKSGKQLVSDLGCAVCHEIRGQKSIAPKAAPDLRREGEKVRPAWLFDFLRKPHALRPWLKTRMPDFRLTEREALAITLFIATQRKPKDSAAGSTGEDSASRRHIAEGEKLFDLYECAKCHPAGGAKTKEDDRALAPDFSLAARRLQPEWIPRWLKNPQEFQTGTKMPNFFYDGDEALEDDADKKIRLISNYVLSVGPKTPSPNFAQAKKKYPGVDSKEGVKLIRELNCAGCHQLSGVPEPEKIGPVLSFAGSKFRRGWLVNFLRNPHALRHAGYHLGWRSRMPGFRLSKEESTALADYLMSLTFPEPFEKMQEGKRMGRRQRFRGRKMFEKAYGCVGCHRIRGRGGKVKGGLSGPDLSKAGSRLRPEFIYHFLKNPRAFEPKGKMPVYGHYLPERDARFLTGYIGSMK